MIISFLPLNKKIQVEAGVNLYQAARENGIDLGGICSGYKSCGKCKALITKGNIKKYEPEELRLLSKDELDSGMRLTCCFTVVEDTCVILSTNRFNTDQISKKSDKIAIREESNNNQYGIAFDIGTTSVVAELWNLNEKEKLGQVSKQNPQTLYGADVISRITYANLSIDHLKKLSDTIRKCCNELIRELLDQYNIDRYSVESVVIAANTTMTHLFLNNSVQNMLRIPFIGNLYEGVEKKASQIGMEVHPKASVYIMPGIGGHVGSDTVACILAKDLLHINGNVLLIDIGTNGEIVLSKDGRLTACSTAAGPAFEGASLHQGMRAIDGAITKIEINQENITVDFIGSEKGNAYPIGICGSGVIESVSELLNHGIIDDTGRLLGIAGTKNYVTLWEETDRQVILTQKDIRELQLAKAAIYAGMCILLREEKITFSQLDKLYLAGAFGSNINIEKAINIGLLPNINPSKIEYIGNGALTGASKLLLSEVNKQDAEQIRLNTKHLELALSNDFQNEFINAISLPSK